MAHLYLVNDSDIKVCVDVGHLHSAGHMAGARHMHHLLTCHLRSAHPHITLGKCHYAAVYMLGAIVAPVIYADLVPDHCPRLRDKRTDSMSIAVTAAITVGAQISPTK